MALWMVEWLSSELTAMISDPVYIGVAEATAQRQLQSWTGRELDRAKLPDPFDRGRISV